MGRHVLAYVLRSLEHRTWDEIRDYLSIDRGTILRNQKRLVERVQIAVAQRCQDLLHDAATLDQVLGAIERIKGALVENGVGF